MRKLVLATLICAALATAAHTAKSTVSSAQTCPTIGPHQGNTSGDYEAVFGRRRLLRKANALLVRVHRKGFLCAKIENEQRTHEVCVNGLKRRSRARAIVRRAHRRGFRNAYVAQS